MIHSFKIAVFLFLLIAFQHFMPAQNPNVIVKCSETTTDYLLNSKNKVKSISHFEVSKKNKSNKKFQSKVWFNTMGCVTKSFYNSPENMVGGNYTMRNSEFNSKGQRTKYEDYNFDKDSVPVLIFSENVVFDSLFRLSEKNTQQYLSKNRTQYITENYQYDQPGFEIVVTQNTNENKTFPKSTYVSKYKSTRISKYISASETSGKSITPDESVTSRYTDAQNYTTSYSKKDWSNELITVENGLTTLHQKTIYEMQPYGYERIRMNMLTGKQDTTGFYPNPDEIGFPLDLYDRKEIAGSSYQSPVKRDTIQLKNGNKKVIVYKMEYEHSTNENKQKISQTLVYNSKMLLLKQDIESLETYTELQYEYYK